MDDDDMKRSLSDSSGNEKDDGGSPKGVRAGKEKMESISDREDDRDDAVDEEEELRRQVNIDKATNQVWLVKVMVEEVPRFTRSRES
jgi:hypothetical protein